MFRRPESAAPEPREATWQTVAEDARRVSMAAMRATIRDMVILALCAGFAGGLVAAILVTAAL
jgi:hypothetical protein